MANTYLQRTESAGNRRTFNWSAWVKLGDATATKFLAACSYSSTDESYFMINSAGQLGWESSTVNDGTVRTDRLFRDVNAWYHIVLAIDTTQATASDRIKFYVNGVQETSFSTATYPAQNHQMYWNVGGTYYPRIGKRHASGNEWNGSMSHVVHIDGTQELPTIFGETDSTTGEWKIKTSITPSSGWGTNGYHILKDGNSLTDQSGQGNNWTLGGGTLTKTEDCPSNVFATLNPLHPSLNTGRSFANGNTYVALGGTARVPEVSTLGMTSGKFYAEAKVTGGSGGNSIFGITGEIHRSNATDYLGTDAYDYSYLGGTGNKINTNNDSSYGATFTTGDIIGIAVDLDNLKIYFSKNGVWQNSGDPTSGATGTGAAFTIASPSSTNDGAYFFACGDDNAFAEQRMAWNFGNGDFSGNTISSAGTNASGNGIFEYDVPTGYTALSTKGLNL